MSKENNKSQLILLADYKEGFAELAGLVRDFEGMTLGSQELYLKYMESCLTEQLDMIEHKKAEVLAEAREFLAKYNSQFKALTDTEAHLKSQLEHYGSMKAVITNEDGQQTERAAM